METAQTHEFIFLFGAGRVSPNISRQRFHSFNSRWSPDPPRPRQLTPFPASRVSETVEWSRYSFEELKRLRDDRHSRSPLKIYAFKRRAPPSSPFQLPPRTLQPSPFCMLSLCFRFSENTTTTVRSFISTDTETRHRDARKSYHDVDVDAAAWLLIDTTRTWAQQLKTQCFRNNI